MRPQKSLHMAPWVGSCSRLLVSPCQSFATVYLVMQRRERQQNPQGTRPRLKHVIARTRCG